MPRGLSAEVELVLGAEPVAEVKPAPEIVPPAEFDPTAEAEPVPEPEPPAVDVELPEFAAGPEAPESELPEPDGLDPVDPEPEPVPGDPVPVPVPVPEEPEPDPDEVIPSFTRPPAWPTPIAALLADCATFADISPCPTVVVAGTPAAPATPEMTVVGQSRPSPVVAERPELGTAELPTV